MMIKDFNVISKLGQGSFGEVYKVRRNLSGAEYALKRVKLGALSEKQIQNALNQVRLLASIKSANIIGYKEAFLEEKNLCIVMQFADDGDLYQKIVERQRRRQHFSEEQIWKVLIEIAKGLNVLHSMHVLHRDLKSANIFLTKSGNAKLGDMNVSKVAKNGMLYTQTGTPYYASPEVWQELPYDGKSDMWSLGVVMYEMAALRVPFLAKDMQELCSMITTGYFPPLPSCYSDELSSVIKMLLSPKPKNRPSALKLLSSSLFTKKLTELSISTDEEEHNPQQLLKTIKVPRNLHSLTSRLPESNYETSQSQPKPTKHRENTLPKIEKLKIPTDILHSYERGGSRNNHHNDRPNKYSIGKDNIKNLLHHAYEDNNIVKRAYYDRRIMARYLPSLIN